MSSGWRKSAHHRRTAGRSTAVVVDFPQFARIFIQLRVLDRGVERLLGHGQASSENLTQQQVSGNLLFFAICASLPYRWIVPSPLYFFHKFSQFSGSDWSCRAATQQTSSQILCSSEADENPRHPTGACRTCCSQKRKTVSASPSNSVDHVTHAVCSIVAPFKTINSREGRLEEWTCSTKISCTWEIQSVTSPPHIPQSRFLGDRQLTSAISKGPLRSNVQYASYKQSTHRWTASGGVKRAKFNLFLDQLPRQSSSSNFTRHG